MKKLIVFLLLTTSPIIAKAEVFGTASTLRPGTVMIGAEVEGLIDPNDFMTNFHLGYGIIERLDLNIRFGAGTTPIYIGGDIEYQLLKNSALDMSLAVGVHRQEEMFIDITPIISHRFKRFSVSTGADLNWKVSGGDVLGIDWFVGTAIPLMVGMDLLFDFGISLKDAPHWVSGGIAIYI